MESVFLSKEKMKDFIQGEGIEINVENDSASDNELDNPFDTEDILKNMSYACEDVNDDGDDEDNDCLPFEQMAKRMKDIAGDGGVLKVVLKRGDGRIMPDGSLVHVHYNAYLELDASPYDSTRLRNKVAKFRLGSPDVLPGYDLAVSTMCKDEFSRFLIRSDYYLGKMGAPPRVPPDATVMMEIEVINCIVETGLRNFLYLSPEERRHYSFSEVLKMCNSVKEEGNELTKVQNWKQALNKYKKAAMILDRTELQDEHQQNDQQKSLLKLYSNMSLCALKLTHYQQTLWLCNRTLEIDPRNVKALYRKGKAHRLLSNFEKAKHCLMKACKLSPEAKEIHDELGQLDRDIGNFNFIQEDMCKKMFSSVSVSSEPKVESTPAREPSFSDISPEFRLMVDKKLHEFLDSDNKELPFPGLQLSVTEIAFILQIAEDLQLTVKQFCNESSIKLVVQKPQ